MLKWLRKIFGGAGGQKGADDRAAAREVGPASDLRELLRRVNRALVDQQQALADTQAALRDLEKDEQSAATDYDRVTLRAKNQRLGSLQSVYAANVVSLEGQLGALQHALAGPPLSPDVIKQIAMRSETEMRKAQEARELATDLWDQSKESAAESERFIRETMGLPDEARRRAAEREAPRRQVDRRPEQPERE
ncbi:MAG: hypothetical protein HY331_17950 [Chloroflexi bacterium]|nr:hypothetical protein [Chloroflexota bacterium]